MARIDEILTGIADLARPLVGILRRGLLLLGLPLLALADVNIPTPDVAFVAMVGHLRDHEGRRLSSSLGLRPDSVYLFQRGVAKPLGRGLDHGFRVIEIRVSTHRDMVAVAGSRPVRKGANREQIKGGRVVFVLDTSDHIRLRIAGGLDAAWSPSGKKLAAILGMPGIDGPFEPDSLVVWDAGSGDSRFYPVRAHGVAWLGEDSLLVSHLGEIRSVALDSGASSASVYKGLVLSPDRRYSYSILPELPCTVLDETAGRDITGEVASLLGGARIRPLPPPLWVAPSMNGHLLAVPVCESKARGGAAREDPPNCATYVIDVGSRRIMRRVPGVFVGSTDEDRKIVSFDSGKLVATAIDSGGN